MDAKTRPPIQGHHKSKSTSSVLKSVLKSASRTPSPTKSSALGALPNGLNLAPGTRSSRDSALSDGHPYLAQRILEEIPQNRASVSPKKMGAQTSHEQSHAQGHSGSTPSQKAVDLTSPYKKELRQPQRPREKENTTPPRSAVPDTKTPIWAQFTSNTPAISRQGEEINHVGVDMRDFAVQHRISTDRSRAAPEERPEDKFHATQTAPTSASPKKKSSRVMSAVVALNNKSSKQIDKVVKSDKEIDVAFESVLAARNVPENMRQNMRSLTVSVKAELVRHGLDEVAKPEDEDRGPEKASLWSRARTKTSTLGRSRGNSRVDLTANLEDDATSSSSKRSRSHSRAVNSSKGDETSSKRARSHSRPRSLMSLKNLSSSSVNSLAQSSGTGDQRHKRQDSSSQPAQSEDFVAYLATVGRPQDAEVGRLQKLRRLLRTERVAWVDSFVDGGGLQALIALLNSIIQLEWREEHEDVLLDEVLLCLKGLTTTPRGFEKISEAAPTLFARLLSMLFGDEKKGPSEFNTRGVIVSLLFAYIAKVPISLLPERAKTVLDLLADPAPEEEEAPHPFINDMHRRRPYQRWCKEISNVTKEVFWIFLHHLNVIPIEPVIESDAQSSFTQRHFSKERPPVPAAPYVGGVEWDATNYLAAHLDLMNGLIAALPSRAERNELREHLRISGFERLMGGSLRLCKEKFYGAVHDGLKTWVGAAAEDGWAVDLVRKGPSKPEQQSPIKSSAKAARQQDAAPPKLELPKMEINVGLGENGADDDVWL